MKEISKYEEYENKLQKLCEENDLSFSVERGTYPVRLTVRPKNTVAQPVLFEMPEQEKASKQAYIRFSFEDGELKYEFSQTFVISDALLAKIKGLFKKMYFYWLQYFFHEVWDKQLLIAAANLVIE